jgi:hypothetical protein
MLNALDPRETKCRCGVVKSFRFTAALLEPNYLDLNLVLARIRRLPVISNCQQSLFKKPRVIVSIMCDMVVYVCKLVY